MQRGTDEFLSDSAPSSTRAQKSTHTHTQNRRFMQSQPCKSIFQKSGHTPVDPRSFAETTTATAKDDDRAHADHGSGQSRVRYIGYRYLALSQVKFLASLS